MRKLRIIIFCVVFGMLYAILLLNGALASTTSGTCGTRLTWTLTDDGLLTISGSGAMSDYPHYDSVYTYSHPSWSLAKRVVISEGVTSIGNDAFSYCEQITEISLPTSLRSIGEYSFYYCRALISINIPANVSSIGKYAFYECRQLQNVEIPSTVTVLNKNVFGCCLAFTNITIPEGVTTIGEDAFNCCTSLESISIPSTITSIESGAFRDCSSLSCEIVIPNGVTAIGNGAFSRCSELDCINLPDTLISIGDSVFAGCSNIVTIQIPDKVETLGQSAFSGCTSLNNISLPNKITNISAYTFNGCNNLEEISFSNDMVSIGDYAFYNCSSLTTITIPNNVTSIGNKAFDNSGHLVANIDSAGARAVSRAGYAFRLAGEKYDLRYVYDWENNESLSITGVDNDVLSIVIPDEVTEIGSEAFENRTNLESVIIPNSLTTVGYCAFLGCPAIRYANSGTDGAKALSVAGYSFREPGNNYDLIHLMSDNEIVGLEISNVSSDVTKFTIPEGITSIGGSAFSKCTDLLSVTIPNSVISIKYHAFYNCSNLKEIKIPDGITSVAIGAFENCGAILHLLVNRNSNAALALSKARYYFHYIGLNYNLKYVFDGDNVTGLELNYIEHDMTSCEILPGVTKICDSAFYESRNLTNVLIPDSVITIGTNAFRYCSELTSLTIPENVETIGNYAFRYCTKLKSVAIMSDSIDFGSSIFSSSPTIYCHKFSDVDVWASQQGFNIVYFEDIEEETIRTVKLPQVNSLACGENVKIFADVFPATGMPVLWDSDHPEIATVIDGVVTAISPGTAVITASVGSAQASVIVECYQPATKIELGETEIWIQAKENVQLFPHVVEPAEATVQVYDWNSSDTTLASVTGDGLVSTIKPGDVIVSATTEKGVSAECLIHLCYPVESIQFNNTNIVNRKLQLVATVTTQDHVYENKLVTFTSSDESVLTVDKDGIVYGETAGKAIVTAVAYNGISATIELTVVTPIGKLILPADLKMIEDEAFANVKDAVIYLPDGIEFISSTAFDPSVTIVCKVNGYAFNRCKDLGLAVLGE